MPSWRNGPLTSLKPAGYLDRMLPVTLPEPLPLLQAASMDSVLLFCYKGDLALSKSELMRGLAEANC